MTTHPVCVKCNVHYAVYGSDYCPKHGGVVPKTIKEYEEIRDSTKDYGLLNIPDSLGKEPEVDWMAEAMKMPLQVIPKDDKLWLVAREIRAEIQNAELLMQDATGTELARFEGKVEGLRQILWSIES